MKAEQVIWYGGHGNECPDCGQTKDKDGKCGCPDGEYFGGWSS